MSMRGASGMSLGDDVTYLRPSSGIEAVSVEMASSIIVAINI